MEKPVMRKGLDVMLTLREFFEKHNNLIPEIHYWIDEGDWTAKQRKFLNKNFDDVNESVWEYIMNNEVLKEAIQEYLDEKLEED